MRVITQEATELKTLAEKVSTLRSAQQHGQSLAHRGQLVDGLLARLRTATAPRAGLLERLGEARSPSPIFDTALARVSEWGTALDDDLSDALSGDLFDRFQKAVENAVREFEQRTAAAWQRYAAKTIPEVSDEVLTALQDDPRGGSTVAKIRRLSDKLGRLRDRTIPTAEELSDFDEANAEVRSAWSTLDAESLDDNVLAFLRAANSDHGAPLELLTTAVLEWLEQRAATRHYVIRPADQ